MIPGQLKHYGYSVSEALSVYGVLTGMAMPMVLFPSVITNSVSVMLLPVIAEAQEKKNSTTSVMLSVKHAFIVWYLASPVPLPSYSLANGWGEYYSLMN